MPAARPFAPVEKLHVLTRNSLSRADSAGVTLPRGRREDLETLDRRLRNIRSFQDPKTPKRIGVFGPVKRGKSTLLNALIGHDLMPTSPIPMSSTIVAVEQDSSLPAWEVLLHRENGSVEIRDTDSVQEVARLIQQHGSRRGGEPAHRIVVRAAFPGCRILERGGVLLDTPGAEVAFDNDGKLKDETERALGILDETHVVLFCVRAGYLGERTDCTLYERELRVFSPLNIVNCRDEWDGSEETLLTEAMNQYNFPQRATLALSAIQARAARQSGSTAELEASGLLELEERILGEIDRLAPEAGLKGCLREYRTVIAQSPSLLPERIHLENFRTSLRACGEPWAEELLGSMEKEPDLWKAV